MVNRRAGEPMLSAPDTAAFFARANGCGPRERVSRSSEPVGRGAGVILDEHADCPAAGRVVEVGILGDGHEWPFGRLEVLGAVAGAPAASFAELAGSVFKTRLGSRQKAAP